MKKYILLILLLVCFLFIEKNISYAYQSCDYYSINLKEINTTNFYEYYNNNYSNSKLLKICSNKYCYNVNSGNLKTTVQDFYNYNNSKASSEEQEIAYVKGYPISTIIINKCH